MFWNNRTKSEAYINNKDLNELIYRIKAGDNDLREQVINDYKHFIIRCVSKYMNKYIDIKNSEEFSIGLIAFNSAIDDYSEEKNPSFLKFAELVINRRLINYINKERKNQNTYPFSYFEDKNDSTLEKSIETKSTMLHFDRCEAREEIAIYIKRLNEFGISLDDLIKKTPKHKDSRQKLIGLAKTIADNDFLYEKLNKKMCIPMKDLAQYTSVSPKTIEKNRKYIVATCIAFNSDLDIIKGFLQMNLEGGYKYV